MWNIIPFLAIFTFAADGRSRENFGVFFIDAVKPNGLGGLLLGNPSSCPFGNLSLPISIPRLCLLTFLQPQGDFYPREEDLSLISAPRERLIRYLGQQCSCGILYFNSISGEQHPVLIFHFGLFFLRAFLLV